MIRLVIVLIFVAIVFIFFLPVFAITWILEKCGVRTTGFLQGLACNCLWIVGMLGNSNVKYIGLEKIPKDEKGVLYILNHQSYFDVMYTYPKCRGLTGYFAKIEIKKVPILSTMMARINCLFIDRSNIKSGMKTMIKAIEMIKNGISIAVFPEGTVNKTGRPNEIQEFKKGSFAIAKKTDCYIQPVAIANSNYVFEAHFPKMKGGVPVVIEYLEPIRYSELSEEAQKNPENYFRRIMQEAVTKNAGDYTYNR